MSGRALLRCRPPAQDERRRADNLGHDVVAEREREVKIDPATTPARKRQRSIRNVSKGWRQGPQDARISVTAILERRCTGSTMNVVHKYRKTSTMTAWTEK